MGRYSKDGRNSIIEPGRGNRYAIGVDHSGKPRGIARPGEATLEVHHSPNAPRVHEGMEEQQHTSRARRSTTGKQFADVAPHKGMTRQQINMAGVGGMGHATSIDGVLGSNPLAADPLPKRTTDLVVKPGMRNRVKVDGAFHGPPGLAHALGQTHDHTADLRSIADDVISDALLRAEPDHPAKLRFKK